MPPDSWTFHDVPPFAGVCSTLFELHLLRAEDAPFAPVRRLQVQTPGSTGTSEGWTHGLDEGALLPIFYRDQ
jgi:hypothetical protein